MQVFDPRSHTLLSYFVDLDVRVFYNMLTGNEELSVIE